MRLQLHGGALRARTFVVLEAEAAGDKQRQPKEQRTGEFHLAAVGDEVGVVVADPP